jgi:3-dehydroquinate synthase
MSNIPYPIHSGPDALPALKAWLQQHFYSKILVLTDHNTRKHCLPILKENLPAKDISEFSFNPGETHKSLNTCQLVWDVLTQQGFDRKSLIINLGGGLVGDLGGFCAATYKRGIDFVQVPTTLLAQVDASVGGKTGVNFQHFKNHIGAFSNPIAVFADPRFFATLPPRELLSGYAEVLKHCLIADPVRWNSLSQLPGLPDDLTPVIEASIRVKSAIVSEDPFEKGPRKALNFGHTVGHGIESVFMDLEHITHGEAVAAGMVCEAFLSHGKNSLSPSELLDISKTVLRLYPRIDIAAKNVGAIADAALQDKKNEAGTILCTLLDGIGHYRINVPLTRTDIIDSLHYYLELTNP